MPASDPPASRAPHDELALPLPMPFAAASMRSVFVAGAGIGIGIADSGVSALIDVSVSDLTEELCQVLAHGRDPEALVAALSAVPLRHVAAAVAMRSASGAVRVVVRGSATVQLHTGDATIVVHAAERDDWVAREMSDVTTIVLQLAGQSQPWVTILSTAVTSEDVRRSLGTLTDVEPISIATTGLAGPSTSTSSPTLPETDDFQFDEMFGRTLPRSVTQAAVAPATDDDPPGSDANNEADTVAPPAPPAAQRSNGWGPPSVGESARDAQRIPAEVIAIDTPPDRPPAASALTTVPTAPTDTDRWSTTLRFDDVEPTDTRASSGPVDAQLGAHGEARSSVLASPPSMGAPNVLARVCSNRHGNPPDRRTCRTCGSPLTDPPVMITRPVLGQLHCTNGTTLTVDRPMVIGRNPKVDERTPVEMPMLVNVDWIAGSSRTHALVRLDGWRVLLEDLGSSNGTVVTSPTHGAQHIASGASVILDDGAEIELGGEPFASFTDS